MPKNYALPENDVEKYKDIIKDYYIWCDKVIGEILSLSNKDTIVIIASDHGFSARNDNKDFFIQMDRFLSSSGLSEAQKNSKVFSVVSKEGDFGRQDMRCLRIKGDLSSEEFEEVRKESKIILENIKLKETGQQIFKAIDDIKTGFFININMRAIQENLENHILIGDKEYNISDFLMPNPNSGNHDKTGIIIISGKNIKQDNKIIDSTIYDIIPTILYMMNLPLDTEMKGKVLFQAVRGDFLEKQPVKYIQTYDAPNKKTQKPIRSQVDEEKTKELMRSLGYIN
jgi:predicted AlkP superfamily phosphohydrolase/phosphomutase